MIFKSHHMGNLVKPKQVDGLYIDGAVLVLIAQAQDTVLLCIKNKYVIFNHGKGSNSAEVLGNQSDFIPLGRAGHIASLGL